MNTYTIEKAYNCLYWQTAVVRAETVEQAIELAFDADGSCMYTDEVALDSAEPGVVACDEWACNGGGAECGPTFITEIALGSVSPDQVVSGPKIAVPDLHSQFWAEWPQEAAELERLREENLRLRGLAQNTLAKVQG